MTLLDRYFPPLNAKGAVKIHPAVPPAVGIPKVVHQTFYTRNLPPELRQSVAKIQDLNPGWAYRFYDDVDVETFILGNYQPHVLDYFKRINPRYGAARADLFRYLLMYKCGGVYLDIKSCPTRPFDDILRPQDQFLLSFWDNKAGDFEGWGLHDGVFGDAGEYQQWYIAAAPGHPFLKAVIENVLTNIDRYNPSLHGIGRLGVLRLTGPIAYTSAIAPLLPFHDHRLADCRSELGFKYSVYEDMEHTATFRSHYTTLTEPVVAIDSAMKIDAAIVATLKAIRRVMRFATGRERPAQLRPPAAFSSPASKRSGPGRFGRLRRPDPAGAAGPGPDAGHAIDEPPQAPARRRGGTPGVHRDVAEDSVRLVERPS